MNIAIILGTTRPGRFGVQVGEWVASTVKDHAGATFEVVDLAEVNLPLFDEQLPPMQGKYANPHTKAWAKTIAKFDGFVFVTGEYNRSMPAALKNAIDYLYAEWRHKPAAFVTYGADSGGMRAAEHLRGTLSNFGVYVQAEQVSLPRYWTQLDDAGAFQPTEQQDQSLHTLLDSIVFWSGVFQDARAKFAAQAQ